MPFLDVPSVSQTPPSFLLDGNKLAGQAPQELAEANLAMPGGGVRRADEGASGSGGLQSEILTPLPGFVLKSSLDEPASVFVPSESSSPSFAKATKLFVNVAHHALVPNPPGPPPGEGAAPLEDLWIPAVISEMGVTVDKAGKTSLVLDAVFHSSVTERAKRDAQYKLFLIQVVLEKVEEKFDIELSRDYATPKTLSSKGPLLPRTVVLPSRSAKPLISPSASPPIPEAPIPTTAYPTAPPAPKATSQAPAVKHALTYPTPTTFVLTLTIPSSIPQPIESAPPPPPTTLQLLPPRTIALVHAQLGSEFRVEVEGQGAERVDPQGLGAEWVVAESVIRVTGRVIS